MKYNWQQQDWPKFRFDLSSLKDQLMALEHQNQTTSNALNALPKNTRHETILDLMVTEAVKTSEIEGEYISRQDVISSIRNQLGLNLEPEKIHDIRAKGAARLMLAVRNTFDDQLSEQMLFDWHRILFEGNQSLSVGAWRSHDEPMQVISGSNGKPRIHFEAPPSLQISSEMRRYIEWYNSNEIESPVVRSAVAHLYFESIHPFEDGNGRIGRSLSEKVLSQGLNRPVVLSLSKAIEQNKKTYYRALESAQKSNTITDWVVYFVQMTIKAQHDAAELIDFVLIKTRFRDLFSGQLDTNQMKVINKMLAAGPSGFEGGMSAKKYSAITGVSKATATRHLQFLKKLGIFLQRGSGRSTRYILNIDGI